MSRNMERSDQYKVFVGNLPETATKEGLEDCLGDCGRIINIYLPETKGKAKYGFVQFSDEDAMHRALAKNRAIVLEGRKLAVEPQSKKSANIPRDKVFYGNKESASSRYSECQVTVTHVLTPVQFMAQAVDESSVKCGMNIFQGMTAICPSAQHLQGPPESSKLYGCQYSADRQWYRCHLVKAVTSTSSEVCYVDYGNTEVVRDSDLVEIPGQLNQQPALARALRMRNIAPKDPPSSSRFIEATNHFISLVNGLTITAKIYEDNVADLLKDGVNIGSQMVSDGYCVWLESAQGRVSDSDRKLLHDNNMSGAGTRSAGPSSSEETHPDLGLGRDEKLAGAQRNYRDRNQHLALGNWQSGRGSDYSHANGDSGQMQQKCSKSCAVHVELANECVRLQKELERLKDDLPIGKKLRNLQSKAAEVKVLRRQFPFDRDDPITQCIKLLSAEEKLLEDSMGSVCVDVKVAHALYEDYQANLRRLLPADGKEKAAEMVPQRNKARQNLCDSIDRFEFAFHQHGLDVRRHAVEAATRDLKQTYGSFLSTVSSSSAASALAQPSLDEQLVQYTRWQAEKGEAVTAARLHTDKALHQLASTLDSMRQSLALEHDSVDAAEAESPMHCDEKTFEETVVCCCDALHSEIGYSKLETSSADALAVTRAVQAVLDLGSRIVHTMHHHEQLAAEYAHIKEQLVPWLTATPDFTDVSAAWKSLKGLRSRLRHRLVDRQDVVENEDYESLKRSNELARLDEEITKLRTEIHCSCLSVENCLALIASDVTQNFPELVMQYLDLNIADIERYGGLYSPFRDLEHFLLQQEDDGNWRSHFNGQPVVIRQYQIGSIVNIDKDCALEYCTKIRKLWNHELQSVFLSSKNSELMMQIEYHSRSLAELKRPLDKTAVNRYSHCILDRLQALHEQGLFYGLLNPRTVFIEQENCVLSVPPLPSQKLQPVDISGLTFNQGEPSPQSDLKDYGKLILWMCSPENEQPAHSHVSHDSDLYDLVSSLLSGQPKTAEKMLGMLYFSREDAKAESQGNAITLAADKGSVASAPDETDDAANIIIKE